MSTLKVGSIQPNSGTKVNITGSTLLITTASGHFSGSYSGDGSGLEGVDGLPYTGSGQISGSLLVTGSGDLALRVSGSTALTGSLFVSGTVSGSFEGDGSSLTGIIFTSEVLSSASFTSQTSYTASHTFNSKELTIDVYDNNDNIVIPSNIRLLTNTSVGLDFATATTGKVVLTKGGHIVSGSMETASFASSGDGVFSGSFSGSLIQGTSGSFSDLTTTVITETSAERFKTNIQSLETQIDKIDSLNPVTFEWINNGNEDIGLIAEQVNEIYPEFIGKNPNGEIQGIKYSKLTAVLIKSIQELNEKNNNLQERIKILEDNVIS